MADRKISDLTALTTTASGDYVPIVDISEAAAASKNKRVTIQSLFQGIPVNVGIGTTSPGAALDVSGNIRLSAGNPNIEFNNGGPMVYVPAGNTLAFATGGGPSAPQERARVDSSGRLLVGTSTANADYNGASSNWNGVFNVTRNAYDATAQFQNWNNTANLNSEGGTSIFISRSKSGTVGTHTALASGDDIGSLIFNASDGSNFRTAASIKATCDAGVSGGDVPGRLVFSTTADGASSPTERMRITNDGKVGIGTTSPIGKVDITGTSVPLILQSTVAAANYITHRHVTSGDIAYIGNGGGGALTGGTTSDYVIRANLGSLIFACNGDNERARIDSSGRVGIGISSPTTLLDVNADTVRVRTARTPASASATGATGEICWDANYIYVCTATNTWKRSALSTW